MVKTLVRRCCGGLLEWATGVRHCTFGAERCGESVYFSYISHEKTVYCGDRPEKPGLYPLHSRRGGFIFSSDFGLVRAWRTGDGEGYDTKVDCFPAAWAG